MREIKDIEDFSVVDIGWAWELQYKGSWVKRFPKDIYLRSQVDGWLRWNLECL